MAKRVNEIENIDDTSPVIEEIEVEQASINIPEFSRVNANINTGLTQNQVFERMNLGLHNKITSKSGKTIPQIIISKTFTLFNLICFAIAGIIIAIKGGDAFSDLIFLFIMLVNTTLGIVQEIKSKRIIDKLSFENTPKSLVIRDGEQIEINSDDLVVDDIIILKAGQKIPADAKIRFGKLEVNESLITGESNSIAKGTGANLYSGSFVVSGNIKAQVTNVGNESYIQKLASQVKTYQRPKSEILKSINTYIKIAALIIIPTITILFFQVINWNLSNLSNVFVSNGNDLVKLTTAILGVLPTGLVLLTSIALATSVSKLGKKKVLVQELYCIEMLARVDTLCLDKTGTITDGTMSVVDVKMLNGETDNLKSIISNILYITKDENQTSAALEAKFGKAKRCKSFAHMPFSSARKYSAVSFSENDTYIIGAPEFISKDIYKEYFKEINIEARKGNRVLLLAKSDKAISNASIGGNISAVALIIIQDNIREAAPKTLKYFRNSGVRVLVISGDNPLTVSAIAKKAGIKGANKFVNMSEIKDNQIPDIVDKYVIFGRVTPSQKQLLVKALKAKQHVVAMTGDGVNDILALKEADCSIAMASGSEAARNVSQLVLLDSDFGAMPFVVAEGRKVINNIQKVATLFIAKNLFCFLICLFVILMNFNLFIKTSISSFPLDPRQLSLIDTLTIGVPATILALSPNNRPISGKFMFNVLKNALPGALVILFNAICIYALSTIPHAIDPINIPTMITISTSIACLFILIKVFLPLNGWKVLLLGSIIFSLYTCFQIGISSPGSSVLGMNFGFTKISAPAEWLLLIVLAQATYPLIWIFSLSFTNIVRRFIKTELANWIDLKNGVEVEEVDIYEVEDIDLKEATVK